MKRLHPIYIALLVCLSGVLLMPVTPFATDVINWHLLSGAYLFVDGFESGDTDQWSTTVSNNAYRIVLKHGSPVAEDILSSADSYGHCTVPKKAFRDVQSSAAAADETVLGFDCKFLLRKDDLVVTFALKPRPIDG